MIELMLKLVPQSVKRRLKRLIREVVKTGFQPQMLYNELTKGGVPIKGTRYSNTVAFYQRKLIDIGENVFIWHYTILDGTGGITIEEGCQIGAWVGIFTHSSHNAIRLYGKHYPEVAEEEKKGYHKAPVRIGRYTFVGPRSIIMPGVTIGKGCIISAGSFVNSDIPDFSIVKGHPAKAVGDTRRLDSRLLRDDETLQRWYAEWQEEGELIPASGIDPGE